MFGVSVAAYFEHFLKRVWHSSEAWTFLATLLRISASVAVLPMLVTRIHSQELGLWYVFASLGSLFALLDLGFAGNVTRATSFLWAGAQRLLPFGIEPASAHNPNAGHPNFPLLGNLVATLAQYYRWAGLAVFLIGTSGGGWWVVTKSAELPNSTSLRCAWVLYAVALLVNFWSGFRIALLNGINGVRRAQQATLIAQVAYYGIVIPGLAFKGGLWVLVCGSLVMGLVTRLLAGRFFRELAGPQLPRGTVDWHLVKVLWPNAWRQGATAAGAYCIVQANTLICSAYLGLTQTAVYGFSMQMMLVAAGLSQVWVQAQLPAINQRRATGDLAWVSALFAVRVRRFIGTFCLGATLLIVVGPYLLALIHAKTTLLPREQLVVLALIIFLEAHHGLYASLVLSENYNPFLWPSVLSGIGVLTASFFLTPHLGVWGMLLAQGVVQAAFNNWWTVKRGVRGLGQERGAYWKRFFSLSPI